MPLKFKKSFLKEKIEELFGIDVRSLALFRISIAVLLIIDLIVNATGLTAYFTDNGVLPRSALTQSYFRPWYLMVHFISGDLYVQALLFAIAGLFAFSMLAGFYTRFATFMSWYFLTSLHIRNPYVLQNGDLLLNLLLFWSIFLPLGCRYSIDSLLNLSRRSIPKRIFSLATAAILTQAVFMYVFAVILKSSGEWWPDGTAVYYALSVDQFSSQFGLFLLKFPIVVKFLTYAVYFFELLGPFLLFTPFFVGHIRTILFFAFAFLQFGMGISLNLGNFPWIAAIAMIPFLPTWFWGKIANKIKILNIKNKCFYIYHKITAKIKDCFKHRNLSFRPSRISNIIVGFFLVYVFLWSLESINAYKMPQKLKLIGYNMNIDHRWNMFAPKPLLDDGWYVITGKLKNGTFVDIFNEGRSVSWNKPELVSANYKNAKNRKYMMNLWINRHSRHPFYFSQYLCYDWNLKHKGEKELESLEIFFVLERTLPDYQMPKHKNISIWKHYCFNEKLDRNYTKEEQIPQIAEGYGI